MAEINNVSTINKFELSDTLLTISNNRLQQSELSLFPAQFYVATYPTLTSSIIALSPISLYDTTYITEINNQLYFNGLKWQIEKSTLYTAMFASKKIMLNRYSELKILNGAKRLQRKQVDNSPFIVKDPNVEIYEPTHIPVRENDIIFLHCYTKLSGAYGYSGSQVTDYALYVQNVPYLHTADDIAETTPIQLIWGAIKYNYDFSSDLIDYTSATISPKRTYGVSGVFSPASWTYYNTTRNYVWGYYASRDDPNFYEDTYLCQGFLYLKGPELFILSRSLFGYYIKDGKNNIKSKILAYENYPVNGLTRAQMQNLVTNPEALVDYA